MKRQASSMCLVGLLPLLVGSLQGQGTVTITGLKPLGGSVTITNRNTGANLSAAFQLVGSPTLESGTWAPLPALFAPLAGSPGYFTTTIPQTPGVDRYFYRVLGYAANAGDLDGDGLADLYETNVLLTNPALFDSDGDGFSDGQELAYGSDPLNPASKPVFVQHPTVNFVLANTAATEGAGPHQMQIVFDRPYNGTVNYAVNSLGNTTAGTDFTLGGSPNATTGSVTMNGTSAFIPLTVINDSIVGGQRVVIIDLKLNGESYFIGGRGSHAVLLEDNDSWWTGSLIPASGEIGGRIFRLKIARHGAGTTAIFGAGAGQDGLPVPVVASGGGGPPIGITSISSSLIPTGSWPATVNSDSAVRFSVDSPQLSVPAGSLLGNETIRRRLQLNAQPALNGSGHPHQLAENRYVGDYTETLSSSSGAQLAAFPGTFILVRDLPAPLPVLSQLVPPTP